MNEKLVQHRMLVVVLLVLDVFYLVADLVHLVTNSPDEPSSVFRDVHWNGDLDGSFLEVFGHTQLVAGVVMLVFLAFRRRAAVYVVWATIITTVVADDFLQLHELIGARVARESQLPEMFGVPPQDLGELSVWASMALLLGVVLLLIIVRSEPQPRSDSRVLLGRIGVLAVFAVGVDQLASVVQPYLPLVLQVVFTLVETAGELVAMTLIVLAIHRMTLATDLSADRGRSQAQVPFLSSAGGTAGH